MKAMALAGIVLILLGILALIFPNIPYSGERDTIRVGPIKTSVETKNMLAVPPIIGGLVLAGGVALLAAGLRKKS